MPVTGRKILRALGETASRPDLLPQAQRLWSRFLDTTYIRRKEGIWPLSRVLTAAADMVPFMRDDLAKVDEALDLVWDPALHGVASNPALTLIPED